MGMHPAIAKLSYHRLLQRFEKVTHLGRIVLGAKLVRTFLDVATNEREIDVEAPASHRLARHARASARHSKLGALLPWKAGAHPRPMAGTDEVLDLDSVVVVFALFGSSAGALCPPRWLAC